MEDNNIKIGARILSDKDLKILLPTYEDINKNIEQMRKMAEDVRERKKGKEFQGEIEYFKQHNNVISILGERGSGKSSVLLSKKYELENNKNNKDIVLPMLVPQDLEGGKDILGWILGYFEENLKSDSKFFNEIKKQTKEDLKDKLKQICKAYFTKRDEYLETLKKIESTTEYVEKNLQSLKSTLSIPKLFNDFIDHLTRELKDSSAEEENLIFIFFDDVDLDGHRCLNVFDIILKYLSHPNIVIFIGGNYNNFKETLTIKYLKDDGLLDKDLMDKFLDIGESFLKERELLAYDYLKKILSPAFRYELKKFTLDEKKKFSYSVRHKNDDTEDKSDKKLDSLEKKINDYFPVKKINKYNDIIYELLDDKPRGLINVYYYLYMLTYKKEEKIDKSESLKQFINILINSNSDLEVLKDKVEKMYELSSDEFLNYGEVLKILERAINVKDVNRKKFINLLKIIFFIIGQINNPKGKLNRKNKEILFVRLNYFYKKILGVDSYFVDILDAKKNHIIYENFKIFLEMFKSFKNEDIEDIEDIDKDIFYIVAVKNIYGEELKNKYEEIYEENFSFVLDIMERVENLKINVNEINEKMNKILKNLFLIEDLKDYILNPLDKEIIFEEEDIEILSIMYKERKSNLLFLEENNKKNFLKIPLNIKEEIIKKNKNITNIIKKLIDKGKEIENIEEDGNDYNYLFENNEEKYNRFEKIIIRYIDEIAELNKIEKIYNKNLINKEIMLDTIVDTYIKQELLKLQKLSKNEIIKKLGKLENIYIKNNILIKINGKIKFNRKVRVTNRKILLKLPEIKLSEMEINKLLIEGKIYINLLRNKLEEEITKDNKEENEEYNKIYKSLCEVITGDNK